MTLKASWLIPLSKHTFEVIGRQLSEDIITNQSQFQLSERLNVMANFLCVNLARPWYPDIWLNACRDVAGGVFLDEINC